MTDKQWENYGKIEDMLTELTALDNRLNAMHYDPEAVPENKTEDIEKLLQALQYANRLARQISERCEY